MVGPGDRAGRKAPPAHSGFHLKNYDRIILCVNLHDLKVHEAIQRHFNIFPQSTVRFLHHQLSSMVCGRSSFFIASGANYSNFHHPPSNFPPYAHGGGGYFQGKMGLDFF